MFSYTFRKLSQQFCASFIFIESCSAFLFKVYINPNRIWDTLMTSKMELFPTIGFCKVILCRFMISVQSVAESISFQMISPCSRRFRTRYFQLVLHGSRQFQFIPACSSFQYVCYKTRAPPFFYFCRLKSWKYRN